MTERDFLIIGIPALMYLAALVMLWRAWVFYDRADAALYESTRLWVEARMAMPRDSRGRFLPRRHIGEDSIGSGEYFDA